MLDQMFQEGLDRRILPLVHSRFSMGGFATPWDIRMGRPRRGMPGAGATPRKPNFQTSGYGTGWVSGHPEITPPADFHHSSDTTDATARSWRNVVPNCRGGCGYTAYSRQ